VDYKLKDTRNSAEESRCPMWWTQAQRRYEGTKHTSELFQIYQPHRLRRPQTMHKNRGKERAFSQSHKLTQKGM
jgi:hypothetical protein